MAINNDILNEYPYSYMANQNIDALLEDVHELVGSIDADIEEIKEDVEALDERVNTAEQNIISYGQWMDEIESSVETLSGHVDEVETQLSDEIDVVNNTLSTSIDIVASQQAADKTILQSKINGILADINIIDVVITNDTYTISQKSPSDPEWDNLFNSLSLYKKVYIYIGSGSASPIGLISQTSTAVTYFGFNPSNVSLGIYTFNKDGTVSIA